MCCRPSGFLSEAVSTHNPIAPWASLAENSGAFWHTVAFMEQRRLTLLRAFSGHLTSTLDTRRRLRSADSATLVVPSTRRTTLGDRAFPSGFRTCVEQFAVIRQECAIADDVPSWSEDYFFGRRSIFIRRSYNCTTLQLLSACGHRLSALLPVLFC